ncbi:hypothetical protein B7494_g4833 [Chlorociboria aeruginascens]|nr:hypothetical protein B7494_g4833 [Chlorociboria aeruginascens]
MTRPEIIRADSIDLQDPNSPSAQDHSTQPSRSAPIGPHQAEALREVEVQQEREHYRSPRVSKDWSVEPQQYADSDLAEAISAKLTGENLHQQDELAVAQNGGRIEEDMDADAEGDDGMEDDMMDKISSSPSIDDGGYSLPNMWPARSDSLSRARTPQRSPNLLLGCGESSSPFVETPDHYPLRSMPESLDKDLGQVLDTIQTHSHHLQGEYLDGNNDQESDYNNQHTLDFRPLPTTMTEYYVEHYDHDYDLDFLPDEHFSSGLERDSINDWQGSEDELMTVPYENSEDDEDDDDDIPYTDSSRFVDSGWGGECLQESEDIDFEFVYALHTFVATVEGQANATKGDTMVLLDDSYLPAEHIETPTERLARLNKHRNIDLTSAMLGDQAEKSKNPLKKVIRRRNAKTVTFAAPTYVEASDFDYSTDEEGEEGDAYGQQEQQAEQQESAPEEDEIAVVEPLKPRAELRQPASESPEAIRGDVTARASSDASRPSDEIFEGKLESSKSRNGTVRNTDSFFKDDSVETRKITLTPNLLRDDSSTSTRTSNESKEVKQRPSLDKLEKESPVEKSKDKKEKREKKDKDKKPGMLSGLFKRKEKRSKSQDDEGDDSGKRGNENGEGSPDRESEELAAIEDHSQPQSPEMQRHPSKLQKHPRAESSPVRKSGSLKESKNMEPQQVPAPDRAIPAESVPAPSMRLVQPEKQQLDQEILERSVQQPEELSQELSTESASDSPVPREKSGGTISKILRSANSNNSEPKPVKAKKAKSRVELDDFDSSTESSPIEEPIREPGTSDQRPIPGSFPDSYLTSIGTEIPSATGERLSESPVQVSPVTQSQSHPPPLMVDSPSQEDPPSPVSSPSPELIDADEAKKGPGSSTTSRSTPTWSDAHLRTFFDDDADIKDLLVVVYDKSGVVPAGIDHPITGNLFREENAKLADITNLTSMAFESGTDYPESDADDEYERSVHLGSPILESDASPIDSEGLSSNEHTPTTYGNHSSSDRLPATIITEWTADECADFVGSLGLRQYVDQFLENEIVGEALVALQHDDLKQMGITSVGHRLTILKSVYDIKIKQDIPIDSDHYVPLSADAEAQYATATLKDIKQLVEQLKLRDERMSIAEMELRRITSEYNKLREDLLPVFRLAKENQPLPYQPFDPSSTISPPALTASTQSGSGLSRKFSTKKLFLESTPRSAASPTYQERSMEHTLDPASAAERAVAASSLLAAGSQPALSPGPSPNQNQPSPTSPPTHSGSLSGSTLASRSYQSSQPTPARSTFPQNDNEQYPTQSTYSSRDSTRPLASQRSQTPALNTPPGSGSNASVEIFKSFRVSMEDPCYKVLPAALKKYNISSPWQQYALYIAMFMLRKLAGDPQTQEGPSSAGLDRNIRADPPGGII